MPKFYARIPNSVIRVMVSRYGATIVEDVHFRGNLIDTEDTSERDELTNAAAQEYLERIADRPGTGISSRSDADIDAEVVAAKNADMRRLAEEAHAKMLAAGQKV